MSRPDRPRLSLAEQLSHAVSVRSAKDFATALAGTAADVLAPTWSRETAPWLVGRLIERFHLPIALDSARFSVPDGANTTFLKGLLWLGRYETLERHAVIRWLPRTLPVVELGAALGVVSCLTNRHLENPARHVCVEANPRIIPVLQRNRDRNGCRFRIVHAALAYGAETITFGMSDAVVDSSVRRGEGTAEIVVPATQLAAVIHESGFERCSLICDIEGAEAALVAEESQVLKDRVHTVIMEVHPHLLRQGVIDLERRLAGLGFTPRWRRGDVWVLSKPGPSPDASG